ncbi:MAG: hypothetical protein QM765_45705 [Myxococcales bacterium]
MCLPTLEWERLPAPAPAAPACERGRTPVHPSNQELLVDRTSQTTRASMSHAIMSFALCLGLGTPFLAGAATPLWNARYGDGYGQWAQDITIVEKLNVGMTGSYIGTLDLGGGALETATDQAVYFAKLTQDGKHVWSKGFISSDRVEGQSVAGDAEGRLAGTGWFFGKVNFGGKDFEAAFGGSAGFVVMFDTNGKHLWSNAFDQAQPLSITIDAKGDVVVTGQVLAATDLGCGALAWKGNADAFVVKYSGETGKCLWSRVFGDVMSQWSAGVATDATGNIVITGGFTSTMNMDGWGLKAAPSTPAPEADLFVAKLEPSAGKVVWAYNYGDGDSQQAADVAIDLSGNIIVTGGMGGKMTLGTTTLVSAGLVDAFVAKFNSKGTPMWAKRFGDAEIQAGEAVSIGDDYEIFVAARCRGSMAPAAATCQSEDAAYLQLSPSGTLRQAGAFGNAAYQGAHGIAAVVADTGVFYLTGEFQSSINFGLGPMVATKCLAYLCTDAFLAKFHQ